MKKRLAKRKETIRRAIRNGSGEAFCSVYLLLFSCLFLVTRGTVCLDRLLTSLRDLAFSFIYYCFFLIGWEDKISPTVNQLPSFSVETYLPFEISEVIRKCDVFWETVWNRSTFAQYRAFCSSGWQWLTILLNLGLSVFLGVMMMYSQYGERHVVKKPRKKGRVRKCLGKGFHAVVIWVRTWYLRGRSYCHWLTSHKKISGWLIFLWLVNTNLLSVGVSFLAYYLYLIVSFDFVSLGIQAVKLLFDLILAAWTLPFPVWCVILCYIANRIRTEKALDTMRRWERKNRGLIQSLSIVTMVTGSMGKGKTRMMVDMALSFENQFREDALRLMDRNMTRFPHFDFACFHAALQEKIRAGHARNWATVRKWVRSCRMRYEEDPRSENLFGYDTKRYAMTYDDGLQLISLWRMLENYAQEYFLYIATCSLIISNFSIRSDMDLSCTEYFPRWNGDFFDRKATDQEKTGVHSHIVDYDLFRLGYQMNRQNNRAGAFEFGVVALTEIGKERGNTLENREMKKGADEANPKNDKFDEALKLIRHAGTVEGVCFVRILTDEQRATSWGANARDTATVISIQDVEKGYTALPFHWVPPWFQNVLLPRYLAYYNRVWNCGNTDFRAVRLLHTVVSHFADHCERSVNRYAMMLEHIQYQYGDLEGEVQTHDYYIMPKKIYANRYATDCYQELFTARALDSGYDFIHSDTYQEDCALLEELEQQSSYLVKGLFDTMIKPH